MVQIKLKQNDWLHVAAATLAGTLFCIAAAMALDYPNFSRLPPDAMANAIRNNILIPSLLCPVFFSYLTWKIRQLEIVKQQLERLASTDSLTELLNRRAFTDRLNRGLEGLEGAALSKGALLVIDADHFKSINDDHGHDAGDEALLRIVRAINASVRDHDVVARLGGEEFGVYVPWIDLEGAKVIAERICRNVEAVDFSPNGKPHRLSVSIGIAMSDDHQTLVELYRAADQALYRAKMTGRNRAIEYRPEQRAA